MGVGVGMSIVVSRSYGAGNMEKLKKAVAGMLVIGFSIAIALTVTAYFALRPLMRMLDTPAEVMEEAYAYISVIVAFLTVNFAYNLFSGLLNAVGNSVMPLVFLVISSVLNIVLDILFITRLNRGVAGVAYATTIAQGVSALLCGGYIALRCRWMMLSRAHFVPEAELYRELASQGFAVGFMNALVFTGSLILQRAINHLGAVTIAAHTTARKINTFCLMPCVTISSSVATMISQNRGAGNRDRINKSIGIGIAMVCGWAVIATAALAAFAPAMATLVSGSSEREIVDNVSRYLRFTAPFYSVLGVLNLSRQSLQSLGQKIIPIISSCIELVGKILFAAFFVPMLGYTGVILCEPLIWCAMTALLLPSLLRHPYLKEKTE